MSDWSEDARCLANNAILLTKFHRGLPPIYLNIVRKLLITHLMTNSMNKSPPFSLDPDLASYLEVVPDTKACGPEFLRLNRLNYKETERTQSNQQSFDNDLCLLW